MSQRVKSAAERALSIVENSSRVRIQDLRDNIGARTSGRQVRKSANQGGHTRGALQHAAKPPLGWIWGNFFSPWQRLFPGEKHFNANINTRREYIPLSLVELSRLIDLGWVNPLFPIDAAVLFATRKFVVQSMSRQYGFYLTAEGADDFTHKIDIEVQYASRTAISAVERAGGRIRVAYYDSSTLQAAMDPRAWFKSGKPVPARKAPPPSLLELLFRLINPIRVPLFDNSFIFGFRTIKPLNKSRYYSDASNRGYLAKSAELAEARKRLALVMGYDLPEKEICLGEKGPTQASFSAFLLLCRVFYGIPPGAVVSLADKKVFLPSHPVVKDYYQKHFVADKQFS
uniref:Large ribosomal subunit protein uL15m n=1 Tax=Angiostrongylus cantonensis TaxID=6313 RepID=A0A0K0CVG5_ANGCA